MSLLGTCGLTAALAALAFAIATGSIEGSTRTLRLADAR